MKTAFKKINKIKIKKEIDKVQAARKDVGSLAEDRRRAQHHGDDHQLDVADPPLSGRA